MKNYLLLLILFYTVSCHTQSEKHEQATIKSLEEKIDNIYQPGFGDIMSIIQIHHAKLWFAAAHHNWDLADFEIHEIEEGIEALEKFKKEEHKDYVAKLQMINEPIEMLTKSIEEKNDSSFKKNYQLLTNTCNSCHKLTDHAFIKIKVPDYLPAINQDFMPIK